MQTQSHSISQSGPFYLSTSATWSPSPSMSSCRVQHSSPSTKCPCPLLCCPCPAKAAAPPGPTQTERLRRNETCRYHCTAAPAHTVLPQLWRAKTLLRVCPPQTTTRQLGLCCEENHSIHVAAPTLLRFPANGKEAELRRSLRSQMRRVVPDQETPACCGTELKKELNATHPTFLDGLVQQPHDICSLHSTCFEAFCPGY